MADLYASNLNGYFFKDKAGRELIANEGATRQSQFTNLQSQLNNLIQQGLVPYAVDSTSDMINTKRIYVIKSTGKWYYYDSDNSTWTIGGTYQASNSADALTAVAQGSGAEVQNFADIKWTIGGVDINTHALNNATDRIRNTTLIKIKAGSVIRFTGLGDGYQFKISLFKHLPKVTSFYIGEPVAFADNATEYTLTQDAFAVFTIKKGSLVEEEEIPDIADYLSTSTIYLSQENYPEPSDYNDILANVDSVSGHYWGGHGGYLVDATKTAYMEIPVKPGNNIRVLPSNFPNTGMRVVPLSVDDVEVSEKIYEVGSTNQGGVAFEIPEGTKYILISTATDITPYARYTKHLDSVQAGIRLINEGAECKLVAHRGLEYFAPEATVPAYVLAGEAGMWGCKLDICETADGKFIMSHDTSVDRMTNGSGNIIDMTLEQLEALTVDAGNHIADYPNEKLVTLEEALAICKKYGMHPYIEFKNIVDKTSVASVLTIIKNYGLLEQTACQCSDGSRLYITWLRELNKDIPIVFWKASQNEGTGYHIPEPLGNATLSISAWNSDWETLYTVLQDFGYPVCMAVMDGNNAISRSITAIEDYGASLIVTDRVTPADIAPNTYTA